MKRLALILALAVLAATPAHAFKLKDLLKQPSNGQSQTQPQTQPGTANNQPDYQGLAKTLFGKTSNQDEIRIGRQIAGNLLGAMPLVKDDDLQRYVNVVGRWVAEQSGRNDIQWYFGVLDSEDINAFAAPGGYVFVTKGLYRRLGNEAELAGVLGHEIAHVAHKDHLKLLKKTSVISTLSQAVGENFKGSDQAVQNLIGNGAEIMARGLDKETELSADRTGVVFAARAGYDPWGLPTVLQDLTALPAGDKRTSLLYKTHPAPADRLAALGDAIGARFDSLASGKDFKDRFYRLK